MMKTAFYIDPVFLQHDTGQHPENAGRLVAISTYLEQDEALRPLLDFRKGTPAEERALLGVHDHDYLRRIEEASEEGYHYLDTPDCVVSAHTYEAALAAAGATLEAVIEVAEGRLDNAFVAARPPGHHAEEARAMGFCYINNVAVAADWLTRHMGYERVLIFDFDVHHGNGTQHTFEARRDVFYASTHQHPMTLFPGTGYLEERGHGEGTGYTLNVPLNPHTGDKDYLTLLEQALLPAFRAYQPQFVILSAGFDAHVDDPLASIDLTQEGFDRTIEAVLQLAYEQCGGRVVSVLEGGYNHRRLAECVQSHVRILQSDPPQPDL